jgi:hypothetical protein
MGVYTKEEMEEATAHFGPANALDITPKHTSVRDDRVNGHPKQRSYQCYYGIPLLGPDGKLLGTVCHFDTDAIPVSGDVVTPLDDLAPIIAEAAFGARRSG